MAVALRQVRPARPPPLPSLHRLHLCLTHKLPRPRKVLLPTGPLLRFTPALPCRQTPGRQVPSRQLPGRRARLKLRASVIRRPSKRAQLRTSLAKLLRLVRLTRLVKARPSRISLVGRRPRLAQLWIHLCPSVLRVQLSQPIRTRSRDNLRARFRARFKARFRVRSQRQCSRQAKLQLVMSARLLLRRWGPMQPVAYRPLRTQPLDPVRTRAWVRRPIRPARVRTQSWPLQAASRAEVGSRCPATPTPRLNVVKPIALRWRRMPLRLARRLRRLRCSVRRWKWKLSRQVRLHHRRPRVRQRQPRQLRLR